MDSKIFAILLFISLYISITYVHGQGNIFTVTDFGASADGKKDSSQAFLDAWTKACQTEGGVVRVPVGTYYVSGVDFNGPCKGRTLFSLHGTIVAGDNYGGDGGKDYWITFFEVDNVVIRGKGTFDGNGQQTWSKCRSGGCGIRPTTLKINYVNNSAIIGVTFLNAKMFHLHIHESDHIRVRNVRITAPQDSPNTDGIHLGKSSNVKIRDSVIGTGDDCVSIGDGCTYVNITGVSCGPGHGISVGSLGKYDVEENVSGVVVRNSTFTGTDNGFRIKTWAPSRSAPVVSDVVVSDVVVKDVRNPILINQFYCPDHGTCKGQGESSVAIKGVKFMNVRGTSAEQTAVNLDCSESKPCQDIEFIGLGITFQGKPTVADCSNAQAKFQGSGQTPSTC